MIHFTSGHFGMGDWKLKEQDGILFLQHRLPFNPRSEYRIGGKDLLDAQVKENKDGQHFVHLTFSEDRQAQAWVPEAELDDLLSLIGKQDDAPAIANNQQAWVKGIIIVTVVMIVLQLIKNVFL